MQTLAACGPCSCIRFYGTIGCERGHRLPIQDWQPVHVGRIAAYLIVRSDKPNLKSENLTSQPNRPAVPPEGVARAGRRVAAAPDRTGSDPGEILSRKGKRFLKLRLRPIYFGDSYRVFP